MEFGILKDYYNLLIDNKKFILIYILFISILSYPMLSEKNFAYPKMEIVSFIFIILLGSFLLLYSFKNDNQIHKVAFVFIFIYGILIVFLAPPFSIPDELVHLVRAETIINGQLIPTKPVTGYTSMYGGFFNDTVKLFKVNDPGISALIVNNHGAWVPFSKNAISSYPGNMTTTLFISYIFSVIGMLITKVFNLGIIWTVWLSRLFNLIIYTIVVSFAIKKAPVYKIPLLFIACTPLLLTIFPSSNYDSFIYLCLILSLSYFIYMYKSKVQNKELLVFFICFMIIAFIKPPYIVFVLLILFIPKENFTFKHPTVKLISSVILVIIVTFLILKIISLNTSATFGVSKSTHVSIVGQAGYLLNHPFAILNILRTAILFIYYRVFINAFYYAKNWVGEFTGIHIYNVLYFIFFIGFSILYPIKIKFSKYKRILMGLFLLAFYFGMFFIICLAWCSVGTFQVSGIQARYFVPIIALLPLVINYPIEKIENNKKIDYYIYTGILIFASGIIMLTVTHFY